MSRKDRIKAANHLCLLAEEIGVPLLLEIFKALSKEYPPIGNMKDLAHLALLAGFNRAQSLLKGYAPWDINCEGYPTPCWYRTRVNLRPKGVYPLKVSYPILNPLFIDTKASTTHSFLPEDLIKACNIIKSPLHLLINMAIEEHDFVYKNLVNYMIQISDRLPLENSRSTFYT